MGMVVFSRQMGHFAMASSLAMAPSSTTWNHRMASFASMYSCCVEHGTSVFPKRTDRVLPWNLSYKRKVFPFFLPPRTCSFSALASADSKVNDEKETRSQALTKKRKIVFLGTPEVAALVLKKLADASSPSNAMSQNIEGTGRSANFEIVGVVSQPGRPRGRSRIAQPSPVEAAAAAMDINSERIFVPEKATDKQFLEKLTQLEPDLCITAAYGNYLPTSFLSIPKFGTLNIHPSLLPRYRGAAPVQRALEDGLSETGVSVLYTVKEMDAGPVLAQKKVQVPEDIQSPELLTQLFEIGTNILIECLDDVWSGKAPDIAIQQDCTQATHAPKLLKDEGLLNFKWSARTCHNKVRAFAGWPGTWADFEMISLDQNSKEDIRLKIMKTRVIENCVDEFPQDPVGTVELTASSMTIKCGENSRLEVLQVQAPGRKAVKTRDFLNGLKGRSLEWVGL